MKNLILKFTLLTFSTFFLSCSGKQILKVGMIPSPTKVSQISLSETKSMIHNYLRTEKIKLSKNNKLIAKANRVANKLNNVLKTKYPLYVVDAGREANAFAFNNNSIVIYEELIRITKSDDELATVVAHEIAHILREHCNNDQNNSSEEKASLFSKDSKVENYQHNNSFERDLEKEADHIGLLIMAKAGYHPEAALSVWNRAEEVFLDDLGNNLTGTHPSFKERVKAIKKYLSVAMEYYEH